MQDTPIKALFVYSASAGSGKTFSLVQNYLKLTLSDKVSPMNFAKILAMTFTNKAAWEMKERVIQALDQLAYPERATEAETKKAYSLMKETQKSIPLSAEKISEKAQRVLTEILHNYEDFNVLTIDKFSLRLIRTFSRDLDLQDNFEVTLDQNILLEQVIDELMSKIGKVGEEEITKLTLSYAKSKLDDGASWNIRNDLISFSKILTKETDQEYVQNLLQVEFSDDIRKNVKEELNSIERKFDQERDELYAYFLSLGTSADDYPGKSRGIYGFLEKLREYSILDYKEPNASVSGALDGSNVKAGHNVDALLIEKTIQLLHFAKSSFDRVYTLTKIDRNFYNLALLRYISNELNIFKERENLIGIFEFGQKISELLKRENASYIYERLGNRYNHYLLDEFQDTSRLQWMNLVPLVHESISHGHHNLIVGDPKQAIYRFRNGLVEQFVALPRIYNPENDAQLKRVSNYFDEMGVKEALEFNFRSKKYVVEFNNSFFKHFVDSISQNFKEYYENIHQTPASKEGGYVEIVLSSEKLNKEELFQKEFEFIYEKVKKSIEEGGYFPGDICILTREKKEGQFYAKKLTEKGYKIVSSDSLIISSDASVNLCMDYLNLRKNTTNLALQKKFASSFFRHLGKEPIVELEKYWKDGKVGRFDFQKFCSIEFNGFKELFFSYENLFDLGVRLMKILRLNVLQNPYLHLLLDLFQSYDLKNGPDIRGFIEVWDAKLKNQTIQMPENNEAIKIMTIHKSKGLEFPVVIIPHLNWKINPGREEQFVQSDDGLLLYSKLQKENAPNFMMRQYQEEYNRILLDQLNVLYVGLTRPSERLYMFLDTYMSAAMSKNDSPSQMNHIITNVIGSWEDEIVREKNEKFIKIGEELPSKEKSTTSEMNNFIPKDLGDFLWFPELALQDEEAKKDEVFNEEQRYGNQLHSLLANSNLESLDEVIQQLSDEDKLDRDWLSRLRKDATSVFELLRKQEFEKNAENILNEQEIIVSETKFKRLDKLYIQGDMATVIDFKTGVVEKGHSKQIQDYCSYLQKMGYKEVQGYLLYTKSLELIKV